MIGESSFMDFLVIEELCRSLDMAGYKELANWAKHYFDWTSENVVLQLKEELKKIIRNKYYSDIIHEGAKYAFMKLETCLSYNNN